MSVPLRYGLALLFVSAVFVLAQAVVCYHPPLSFTAFALSAIACTFRYGGTKPDILAASTTRPLHGSGLQPDLAHMNRMTAELAASLAHEITQPIGTARNNARADVAVGSSSRELRATLDSIPTLAWRAGADGCTEYINKRWVDYTGVSLDQTLGWQRLAVIHPDDVARLRHAWLQALTSEQAFDAEARMRRSDGSYRWFLIRAEPSRDDRGAVVAWYGTSTDIQDLKTTETALRRSEVKIRRLVDANVLGVCIWNLEGAIAEANETFLRMLQYDREDIVLGRLRWTDLTPAEWRERDQCAVEELRSTGTFQPFEKEYFRRDGSRIPVLIGGALFEEGGKEAVAFVLDLTECKRAEEALRKLESDFAHVNRVSMMGELAVSLAHEITQPIGSAHNNACAAQSFLDVQPPELGEVKEAVACVIGDVERAGAIIERIREHMKNAPPRKERFDLNAAINEVIGLARSAIIGNGVSVQTRLADGLFSVQGDRVQLQQVVLNLMLNAVEAMGSVEAGPRELSISTEQDHTGILVALRDSGPGIDSAHLERVFEAFYTTKPSGVGMGLAICRSIIDAHGGRLWAQANEPCGAAFHFTLPSREVSS